MFSLTHNYFTVRIQGLGYRLSIMISEFRFKIREYIDIWRFRALNLIACYITSQWYATKLAVVTYQQCSPLTERPSNYTIQQIHGTLRADGPKRADCLGKGTRPSAGFPCIRVSANLSFSLMCQLLLHRLLYQILFSLDKYRRICGSSRLAIHRCRPRGGFTLSLSIWGDCPIT